MSNIDTWDQIRTKVRAFHADQAAHSYPFQRDFVFDARFQRMYFLGNERRPSVPSSRKPVVKSPGGYHSDGELSDRGRDSSTRNNRQNGLNGAAARGAGKCMSLFAVDMRNLQACPGEQMEGFSEEEVVREQMVEWEPLVTQDWLLRHAPGSDSSPSKEEEMMRERRRISAQGILNFQYIPPRPAFAGAGEAEGLLMFAYHNGIFVGKVKPDIGDFTPLKIPNPVFESARLDPKVGGVRNHLLSFIRDRDLYVATFDGKEQRLTWSDACISHGIAEYIMQEEFRRFTGYWWCPWYPQQLDNVQDLKERILYIRTDHSLVEVVHLTRPGLEGDTDEYRYPKAGKFNVIAEPELVEFGSRVGDPIIIRKLHGSFRLDKAFPWMEYIVRAGWIPSGKYAYFQLLDRLQSRTALVLVPLSLFQTEAEYRDYQNSGSYNRIRILVDETFSTWVNVTDITQFFQSPAGTKKEKSPLEFVWASEQTGWRHLYHGCIPSTESSASTCDTRDTPYIVYPRIELRQLTFGEWTVVDHPVSIDQINRRVYFTGKADNILESHLYVVDLEADKEPAHAFGGPLSMADSGVILPSRPLISRLTELGLSHVVAFNNECSFFVNVSSSFSIVPRCKVGVVQIEDSRPISRVKLKVCGLLTPCEDNVRHHRSDNHYNVPLPEVFSFENSEGVRIYGLLYKPKKYQTGRSYPTILRVYGGPNIQVITNDYKHPKLTRVHLAVSLGYCVLLVDGRGSGERGVEFEGSIKHRLGTVEVRDQIEALAYIALRGGDGGAGHLNSTDSGDDLKQYPIDWSDLNAAWMQLKQGFREGRWGVGTCVDLERVAVTGWSYGGYLSLLMLAQYPSIFKMCLAGAPVTNWELYDTAYTERFMGLPADNQAGYAQGCVFTRAHQFPNQENRLLLVHGLQDENVHFKNTQLLISALVKHNKPHQTQVYPAERHGLRLPHVVEHFETLMFWWLGRYL
ncbi:dipeptidyl peptidase IV N-terminal region-domain-containing protein [Powellomyces hirtus]|nr:dipeptidyl peptidase IV N-terminal region-domain-containing protein [Powellomyces hirtus]